MSKYGTPVTAVMVERCRHCGTDAQDILHREVDGEVGMGGHVFEAMPFPTLDGWRATYRQTPRWVKEGSQRLTLQASAGREGSRRGAQVWAWRDSTSLVDPDAAEWRPLERAVEVLLARKVCLHTDQNVCATVVRHVATDPTEQDPMPPTTGFSADIRVWCRDCGEPFVWVGPMQLGVNPGQPTVDVEGTTLCAPLRPLSAPEDFGLQRPGFGVRVR